MQKIGVAMVRVSTKEQADSGSGKDVQEKEIRAYAESLGFRIDHVLFDDITGDTELSQRPNQKQLLELITKNKLQGVFWHRVDRISRKNWIIGQFLDKTLKTGVEVHTCERGRITDDNDIATLIDGWKAQEDKRGLTNRMAQAKRHLAENGIVPNNRGVVIPLGYRGEGIKKAKRLVIDPDTSPIIEFIFEQYSKGAKIVDIARELNKRGYKTPKGKHFGQDYIYRLLKNPAYIGEYSYGKRGKKIQKPDGKFTWSKSPEENWIKIPIPPIINQELWDKCRARIVQKPFQNKINAYLLSGFFYCDHDKRTMLGSCTTKKNTSYRFYRCSGKRKYIGAKHCTGPDAKADIVEQEIAEYLIELMEKPIEFLKAITVDNEKKTSRGDELREDLAGLEKRIAKIEGELAKLLDLYLSTSMDKSLLQSKENELNHVLANLKDEKVRIGAELAEIITATDVMALQKRLDELNQEAEMYLTRYSPEAVREWSDSLENEIGVRFDPVAELRYLFLRDWLKRLRAKIYYGQNEQGERYLRVESIMGNKLIRSFKTLRSKTNQSKRDLSQEGNNDLSAACDNLRYSYIPQNAANGLSDVRDNLRYSYTSP